MKLLITLHKLRRLSIPGLPEMEPLKAVDIIAPSSIEIKPNYIKLGEKYAKTFFIFS